MIAPNLETAFARYLTSQSDAVEGGSVYKFNIDSGDGAALSILQGHSPVVALPEDGFIVAQALDSDIKQTVVGVNLFEARVTVALVYPAHAHENDPDTLVSFQSLITELDYVLMVDDLANRLTEQRAGVAVQGLTSGFSFKTNTAGQRREAEWQFELACNSLQQVL